MAKHVLTELKQKERPMSLSRKMILFITLMVLALLVGTFAFNLNNTKDFLQKQLKSHAEDTATSLGLSISTVAEPDDLPLMETMINAVFDRGYYKTIVLKDMDENLMYQRQNAKSIEGIPDWFIEAIPLETPSSESAIQAGWTPIGTLSVSSNAGYAYMQLWQTFITLLYWFIAAALIAIVIAVYTIRLMLQPLKKIENQAEAIVKKQYIIQEPLPSTTEFKQVVIAMNAMINKLRGVFERDANAAEKLQKMAYQDTVTGLSNRRHFDMIIDSILDPKQDAPDGAICLLRINHLKELNDQFGYLTGDKLVKLLAEKFTSELTHDEAVYARLNGTELIALLPRVKASQLKAATDNIASNLPQLHHETHTEESTLNISIAFSDYQPGNSRGALLGQLDYAIEQAEGLGENRCYLYENQTSTESQKCWEETINQAIDEKRFVLYQQSAYDSERQIHDQELFIRLQDIDGVIRSAGYFMPAVEQLNKIAQIDKLVIDLMIQHLKTHLDTPILAMNISKAILEDETLQQYLLNKMSEYQSLTRRIAIELPERLVTDNKAVSWPLIRKLKELGVTIGIDHFGARLGNMHYLQDLHPDYVKLDASFTKAIDKDEQTQTYLSSLCELTSNLDINVIGMALENEEQTQALRALGVVYYQGYLFGAPSKLID